MNPLDRVLEDGTYLVGARGIEQRVDYRTGYWVAEPNGLTTTYAPTVRQVAYAARTMGTAPGEYIGVWTDTESGITYIDRAHHVSTRPSAERLGVIFGQLAIWNCAEASEIPLTKGETSGPSSS